MSEFFVGRAAAAGDTPEQRAKSAVDESVARMTTAANMLHMGRNGALVLKSRRQTDPATCFFSGPIQVGEQFHQHPPIDETILAQEARNLELLNGHGACTHEVGKWPDIEAFVHEQTGTQIRFGYPRLTGDPAPPAIATGREDLRIIQAIAHGNLVNLMYPLAPGRGEWVTVYQIDRDNTNNLCFYMTFSGSGENGVVEKLDTNEMAGRLYGVPGGPPPLICAIEIQMRYDVEIPPMGQKVPIQPPNEPLFGRATNLKPDDSGGLFGRGR